ncbi:hypothetical protein V6N11_033808 [Hibiscus sabdariffa]|uniref:Uncharacterized protein n=1 Tax=Hibiscus sabdariffa TaxID=183260 RepID=A0ABR2S0K7_9ROSI
MKEGDLDLGQKGPPIVADCWTTWPYGARDDVVRILLAEPLRLQIFWCLIGPVLRDHVEELGGDYSIEEDEVELEHSLIENASGDVKREIGVVDDSSWDEFHKSTPMNATETSNIPPTPNKKVTPPLLSKLNGVAIGMVNRHPDDIFFVVGRKRGSTSPSRGNMKKTCFRVEPEDPSRDRDGESKSSLNFWSNKLVDAMHEASQVSNLVIKVVELLREAYKEENVTLA